MTKEEQIREIVYRNWKNGDEIGLYKDILYFRRSELEEIRDAIQKMNEPVPCDCPKGGLAGENEIPCDKCGGSQWTKNHICRFNDAEQNCECYEKAIKDFVSLLQEYLTEKPPLTKE